MNESKKTAKIILPTSLKFTYGEVCDFDRFLGLFDWSLKNSLVEIDFRYCRRANYQALSLVVLYIWFLKKNGCEIAFLYGDKTGQSATTMWYKMNAERLFDVLNDTGENFGNSIDEPLIPIRNSADFRRGLEIAENYTKEFDIEYEKTLRYVVSELLYNTLEHGSNSFAVPSLLNFKWYRDKGELSFVIADLGIGIKRHLSQSYPELESNVAAIKLALKPQVSGTFGNGNNPYGVKNNAGVGLYISSNIIRKLHADMYIISGDGMVHVSPTEVTQKTLHNFWNGSFVYVTLKFGKIKNLNLQKMMSEFRESAIAEISKADSKEQQQSFYLSIKNYFGRYAEDKSLAIRIRDEKLLFAISEGKTLTIDFEDIISAPHSLLNALLATPIQRLSMAAYKKIKVINASPEIRETIDFILDENTSSTSN
ncbi:MAG: DUF4325 domain-containing protein [Pyrinomonadaceae bacterium]|nr:DUF4325 domain-containing protein [Pyrinomonadaceae bacterium]